MRLQNYLQQMFKISYFSGRFDKSILIIAALSFNILRLVSKYFILFVATNFHIILLIQLNLLVSTVVNILSNSIIKWFMSAKLVAFEFCCILNTFHQILLLNQEYHLYAITIINILLNYGYIYYFLVLEV